MCTCLWILSPNKDDNYNNNNNNCTSVFGYGILHASVIIECVLYESSLLLVYVYCVMPIFINISSIYHECVNIKNHSMFHI